MWSTLASPQSHAVERRAWLEQAEAGFFQSHSRATDSSHALLVFVDAELAFLSGAWLSVIIASHVIVECTLRQVRDGDYVSTAQALTASDADLQWLRSIRNELMHAAQPGTPSQLWKLPPSNVVACDAALEPEAKRAIRLAYKHVRAFAKKKRNRLAEATVQRQREASRGIVCVASLAWTD